MIEIEEGLIKRVARKSYKCRGNGAGCGCAKFAEDHKDIQRGDIYIECLWEARPFESGGRVCLACAEAFYLSPARQRQRLWMLTRIRRRFVEKGEKSFAYFGVVFWRANRFHGRP